MGKYFGTDGFRGEANQSLTGERAYKIGRFLGYWYSLEKKDSPVRVVVGKDTRRSSYMLEYSLAAGLTASGAGAYLLHVTTTACVSYITAKEGFDCGIMISASHNPYYDNGIKLINSRGEKTERELTELIEKYLDGEYEIKELPLALRENIGTVVDYASGRRRYTAYLTALCTCSLKGLRVGLDCANGSAHSIAQSIFQSLGAEVYVIGNTPDGKNINCKCGSTDTRALEELVIRERLDAGFAYDGDADRCICVDEEGRVADGDFILYGCAMYMKRRGFDMKKPVVTTVMSNAGLYKALDREGIAYGVTDVGDKNVYDYMVREGSLLGGEQSGHIIFSPWAATGDGILTSLKLMEAMAEEKRKLSELFRGFEKLPELTVNVGVRDKRSAIENRRLRERIETLREETKNEGSILVRASGTEPVIRITVQGKSKELCEKITAELSQIIKNTQR